MKYDCSLPALSKTAIKNKKTTLGEGGALTCQFCPLPPPPLLPPMVQAWSTYLFPRLDSHDAAAGGGNILMPLHRAIFTLVFFHCKLMCAGSYDASKKSHFRCVAPIVSPFRPSIPIISPPAARAPLPPMIYEGVRGAGFVIRFQGSCCSFYFCSAGQIKKSSSTHAISPSPALQF